MRVENEVQFNLDKIELVFFIQIYENRFRDEIRGAKIIVREIVAKIRLNTVY